MPNQEGENPPSKDEEGAGDERRAPTARGMSPEEGKDPPIRECALPAHVMPEWEEGRPRRQDAKEGSPPEQRALPAYGMQGKGGT